MIAAGLMLCCVAGLDARQWTSPNGATIEAELVDANAQRREVLLLRADGRRFRAGWDRFSLEDQEFLADWCAQQEATQSVVKDEGPTSAPAETEPPPDKLELRDVPMVKQIGAYCVPASASMIAAFHGIEADQELIAILSSGSSEDHEGTYPSDMALAMRKLGFRPMQTVWEYGESDEEFARFQKETLPLIVESLYVDGPVYVSFKAGVFGPTGHGCVIIGYNNRRERFELHNPWGNAFSLDYEDFAVQTQGMVRVKPPVVLPPASDDFRERVEAALPVLPDGLEEAFHALAESGIRTEIALCSRRDERDDRRFAEQTARREGRQILDLAFNRVSAVLLPKAGRKGELEGFYYITQPPEGGARYLAALLDDGGWGEPELLNIGDFARDWALLLQAETAFTAEHWDLPLIELHAPEVTAP